MAQKSEMNALQRWMSPALTGLNDLTGGGFKAALDLGTVAGNGLLLGQGAAVKGGIGYAARKATNALGLTEGELTMADAMKPTADAIADARAASGSAGRVMELGAGLIAGGGLPGALMRGGKALARVPGMIASGAGNPLVRQAAVGAGVLGTTQAIMDDPSDPVNGLGSKQPGPAAAAQQAAPTAEEQEAAAAAAAAAAQREARINTLMLNPKKLARILEIQKLRPQALKPSEALQARINQFLDADYNQGMEAAGDDPAAQALQTAQSLRAAIAAKNPSGAVYFPVAEE